VQSRDELVILSPAAAAALTALRQRAQRHYVAPAAHGGQARVEQPRSIVHPEAAPSTPSLPPPVAPVIDEGDRPPLIVRPTSVQPTYIGTPFGAEMFVQSASAFAHEPPVVSEPVGPASPSQQVPPSDPLDAALIAARLEAASMVATAHTEAISILSDAVAEIRDDRSGVTSVPITVVLDAESFAKAFASAMAGVLEKRPETSARQIIELGPQYVPLPQLGAVPVVRANGQPSLWPQYGSVQKKSFWANAWHPDVLLSVVAMIIVLIVLVAFAT